MTSHERRFENHFPAEVISKVGGVESWPTEYGVTGPAPSPVFTKSAITLSGGTVDPRASHTGSTHVLGPAPQGTDPQVEPKKIMAPEGASWTYFPASEQSAQGGQLSQPPVPVPESAEELSREPLNCDAGTQGHVRTENGRPA